MKQKKILSEGWKLKNILYGEYPARVPGDITNDLYRAGRIPDPLFGVNFKELDWILRSDWEYSCEFEVSEKEFSAKKIDLSFGGVDTFSEIFLNGRKIGETDSMFLAYEFNVKGIIKVGVNVLTVKMISPYTIYESRKNEKYLSIFHPNRIFYRKPACHFMWDWAPDFPGYGIYRPVSLITKDCDNILQTEIAAETDGRVSFIVKLEDGFKEKPKGYSLRVCVTKDPDGDFSRSVEVRKETTGQLNILNLRIEDAKLWWPNGYGEANLYSYRAELLKGEKTVDVQSGRFGFRKVTLVEKPIDENSLSFIINVNGTDIFCKGSNWVPASNMTGTVTEEKYQELLCDAKEANYNLLRVWGGGLYEHDRFYELCDELGIMVWQDFMFACSDLPDDDLAFRKTVYKEAEYQLLRLRNHSCIAIWCGGNERRRFLDCKGPQYGEYIWEIMLRGLHAKLTRNSVYVPNSPHSRTDMDMDYGSGDLHTSCYDPALIENKISEYRGFLAENKSPFTTECAILGPCRIKSLERFIPREKLWPVNEIWHEHFMLNPYAFVPEETFLTKEFRLSEALFGKVDTLEEFVKKAMAVHYEILRSEIEYARASKRCYGILNWMYNDIWGCGTWSVVDFYGEKKPAFYAQKSAFKPVHVFFWFDGEKINLSVANDFRRKMTLSLSFGQRNIAGDLCSHFAKTLEVNENSVCTIEGIDISENVEYGYLFAEISGGDVWDKSVYFYDLWKDIPWKTDLAVERKRVNEGEVILTIKAKEFARMVFIDTPDNRGVTMEDNYFDMEKGETRNIRVFSKKALEEETITVKTFADEWTD